MKILMTADAVGGVWTYALELMRGLPDCEFVLATMGEPPSDEQRAELPPNAKLAVSRWKLEWQDDPWDDVRDAGEWLLDLEAREKPDLVHLDGYAHGQLPFIAPKLVVAHSCVLSWWSAVKGERAPESWNRYRDQVERGLQEAALVVAPSAAMLGTLDAHYRFDTPSRVIHNGRTFSPRVSPNRNGIFAAGRLWDEAKNLAAVIAAAPSIAWPVRIAGDGGSEAANVEHLGRLDRSGMATAYGASAIYLFPALYEPFGLSILEAALSGCALILGDIGSLRELWDGCALFVPPRDPAAIAAATNELIGDRSHRDELARRAVSRGRSFTTAKMAEQYRHVYATLCRPDGEGATRGHGLHDAVASGAAHAQRPLDDARGDILGDRP
jgi:glycogen(starch) synthase